MVLQKHSNHGACLSSRALLLAWILSAIGCSKPQGPQDGKPVAISPLQNSDADPKKAKTQPIASPSAEVWASLLPTELKAFVTLDFPAGFKEGRYDGMFEQSRCADGVKFKTTIKGLVVIKSYTLFDDKACQSKVEEAEPTYTVKGASKETIDLIHEKETKALFLPSDIEQANDASNPMCAVGWPEVGKFRDVTNLGTCKLEEPLFTILVVLKKEIGMELRWGTTSTQIKGKEMNGSSADKRHVIAEELAYLKMVK